MAKPEIKLASETRRKNEIKSQDPSGLVDGVAGLIKKLFVGLSFEKLEKQIELLKEKERNNALSEADKEDLPRILRIFATRKGEVEDKVTLLFKEITEASTSLTNTEIKAKAADLINDVGESSALTPSRRKELAEVFREGVKAARTIKQKSTSGASLNDNDRELVANWRIKTQRREEVENSRKLDASLGEFKGFVERNSKIRDLDDIDQIAKALEDEKSQSQSTKSTEELLKPKDTNKREELKSALPTKHGKIMEWLSKSDMSNDQIMKKIKQGISAGGESLSDNEKSLLLKIGRQVDDLELALQAQQFEAGIDGVGLNLNKIGLTRFEMAGVEIDTSVGNLKKRLSDAIKKVDFDIDQTDANAVALQKKLLLATGITSDQADLVWENIVKFRADHGDFLQGVNQLRFETIAATLKLRGGDTGPDSAFDYTGLTDAHKYLALIKEYVNGEVVYTEEGRERMSQLDGVMVEFEEDRLDDNGVMLYKIKSFNRFEDFAQRELKDKFQSIFNSNQQRELLEYEENIRMQKMAMSGDPKAFEDYLKHELEQQIMKIYSTGDASRAPGNSMASYKLYSIIGELGDADYKTTWMARLAIYDVKMFMSGVENYEEWAKVNSFLPIDYREALHRDELIIGEALDVHGSKIDLKLNFADIYTMYELKDGTMGGDVNDVWIARILNGGKSRNMAGLELSKRQFMAANLGEQLGIQYEFRVVNGEEQFLPQGGSDVIIIGGEEVSLRELVGLDHKGHRLVSAQSGKVDLRDMYGWYMDMPIDMGHLERRWVGIERGGNDGDWWMFGINGLRKLHGLAQVDYHKRKQMSMETAVDEMDSGWRSTLGWKLFETHKGADKKVFWGPIEGLIGQRGFEGSNKKELFFEMMKQAVYLPEYFTNNMVAGELRTVAEVRELARGGKEYGKVLNKYRIFDPSNNFDWSGILGQMGVKNLNPQQVSGEAGLKLFLEKFSLHRLISYDGIPHNLIADDIKYTGYSEKFWQASVPAGDHIWDTKTQFQLVDTVGSYHGKKGKEWKSNQLFNRQVIKGSMSNWEGQKTYVDEKGKQATVLWKAKSHEIAEIVARGWRVDNNGYVRDENNIYRYREGRIGFWEGFLSPYKKWAKGSSAGQHFGKVTNWKSAKEILSGYLKSRMVTPDQYEKMSKRLKLQMYFDADIEWNEEPTFNKVLQTYINKPWKLATLPYNILRGIAVDLGLESEDWVSFFAPMGKEVSKQFSGLI